MAADAQPTPSPETWLTEHGEYLYRYALLHLRDPAQAEDAVQDTLLAGLEAFDRFAGQSSLRTWLTGILKHKILDFFRRQSREPSQQIDDEAPEKAPDPAETLFDSRGHWAVPLQEWGNPDAVLNQKRFWAAFQLCLKGLPQHFAMVFSLREISGLSTEDICKDLQITSTNCWVMLHRARLGLQQCLQENWGGPER
jgi:RNA polymerase sigma-70 factor (ECF subfamily)